MFWPYLRDPETLARPWAPPGLAGLEHRIGGLEKSDGAGNVAYDGANHERMTRLRAAKIAGIAADIPPTEVDDEDGRRGPGHRLGIDLRGHRRRRPAGPGPRPQGRPGPPGPPQPVPGRPRATCCARYERVLVPEVNLGQLSRLLRAEYLVDAVSLTQVSGIPFRAAAMESAILQLIDETAAELGRRRGVRPMTDVTEARARPTDHPQGLVLGPGGAVVPRVR